MSSTSAAAPSNTAQLRPLLHAGKMSFHHSRLWLPCCRKCLPPSSFHQKFSLVRDLIQFITWHLPLWHPHLAWPVAPPTWLSCRLYLRPLLHLHVFLILPNFTASQSIPACWIHWSWSQRNSPCGGCVSWQSHRFTEKGFSDENFNRTNRVINECFVERKGVSFPVNNT